MELKIVEKKENQLLSRIEISGVINFTGATPSADALKKDLAKSLQTSEENIAVKEIYSKFGLSMADFRAYAYKTKEKLAEVEPKKKAKKEKKENK